MKRTIYRKISGKFNGEKTFIPVLELNILLDRFNKKRYFTDKIQF